MESYRSICGVNLFLFTLQTQPPTKGFPYERTWLTLAPKQCLHGAATFTQFLLRFSLATPSQCWPDSGALSLEVLFPFWKILLMKVIFNQEIKVLSKTLNELTTLWLLLCWFVPCIQTVRRGAWILFTSAYSWMYVNDVHPQAALCQLFPCPFLFEIQILQMSSMSPLSKCLQRPSPRLSAWNDKGPYDCVGR